MSSFRPIIDLCADIETDDILDVLLDDAIDEYESLHTSCREQWRIIESGLTCNYVPSKPYFLNDGLFL